MMEEKIKATGIMKSQQAISFFEEILNHIKEGGVHFEHECRSIDLTRGDAVEMEVKAKHKDGIQKLEFELVWKDDLHLKEMSGESIPGLKVSSKRTEEFVGESERGHVGAEAFEEPAAAEAAVF